MFFSIIAAVAKNNVIGKNNQLPWDIPEDQAHFYKMVEGKPVVMGRKTYESMGGPIKNCENVVLSHDGNLQLPGCLVLHSLDEVLQHFKNYAREIMVIGGAPIYEMFLPLARMMYLTLIHQNIVGDVYFPKWQPEDWVVVSKKDSRSDLYCYSFLNLQRRLL